MYFYYKKVGSESVISAIRVTKHSYDEVEHFCGEKYAGRLNKNDIRIDCTKISNLWEYIIKDIDGNFYSCPKSVFERSYKMLSIDDVIKYGKYDECGNFVGMPEKIHIKD